ncbi:LytTR family DNA-binding domain-containing protein [Pedobacter frigidisoli]|uniref:LytTR family DNA-binding domain-containing protein n=1 Tax=Pedobacter frigidisoli TaxID=2530455 RepID=UPI00292F1706|nr:LytTR family DNA-binding domain-containing protein [Pedobacter frigidisoli]
MHFSAFCLQGWRAWVHLLVTLFISFLAGLVIVMQFTGEKIRDLIHEGYYYISISESGAIAFVLIWYIYAITCWLNSKDGGFKLTSKRFKKQFFYGVAVAAGIELMLAGMLYHLNGRQPFGGSFFYHIFMMVLLFLMVVNSTYCFYFEYMETRAHRPEIVDFGIPDQDSQPPLSTDINPPTATEDTPKIRYVILPVKPEKKMPLGEDEFCYIICVKNLGHAAYHSSGEWVNWDYNLTQSLNKIKTEDYFRINKQALIHWRNIKELQRDEKILYVIPHHAYEKKLLVSRSKKRAFKKWYFEHMRNQTQ